ncbi:unnamed protein product [Cuscuta campestris]|uniref:Uncharacterized protein n=1 Tax=Cuscuta campestris TaxID=132261 RepID=A0A484KX45_9ASTE|nr:unnamed protein product [Cuscuta campestris]
MPLYFSSQPHPCFPVILVFCLRHFFPRHHDFPSSALSSSILATFVNFILSTASYLHRCCSPSSTSIKSPSYVVRSLPVRS